MVPIPAGPITNETTNEGRNGNSIFRTNIAIAQIIPPKIVFIINFFKKKIRNIVAIIKTIPITMNKGGFTGRNSVASLGIQFNPSAKRKNKFNSIIGPIHNIIVVVYLILSKRRI